MVGWSIWARGFAVGRIVVYNRGGVDGRSANMLVSTSLDGETWTQVHDCAGQAFGGAGGGEPLTITLDAHTARFVKCHLPAQNYFHLDEVEVYASGDDATQRGPLEDSKPEQREPLVCQPPTARVS